MNTKHTAGPWIAGWQVGNELKRYVVAEKSKVKIVLLDPDAQLSKDEIIANRNLITAAPELLEALQRCISTLEERERYFGVQSYPLESARAAIAKAKGAA